RSLTEQGIPLPTTHVTRPLSPIAFGLLDRHDLGGDRRLGLFVRGGGRTIPVPRHQPLRLFGRDVSALQTHRFALARGQEQHVPVSEQGFGAVPVEDRAAVHLGRYAEGDTAGKVC